MNPSVDRRDFLRVGALAGLSLAEVLRMQDVCRAEGAKRDINCIFLFIVGLILLRWVHSEGDQQKWAKPADA